MERTAFGAHRDAQRAVGMRVEQRLRQAGRFLAEHDRVAVREVGVRIVRAARVESSQRRRGGERCEERVERRVHDDAERVPVVETRAFELAVVDAKAERLDEVQRAARRGAEACDVAGVRRDLGFDQNDVQRRVAHGVDPRAMLRLSIVAAACVTLRRARVFVR